jgi:AraC-like DNA-binding protein
MERLATIGTLQLTDILDALRSLGVTGGVLRAATGVPPNVLRNPEARVPTAAVVGLFAEAERRTGDPFVGLHAAQHANLRGPLSYLLLASGNLGQGLRQVEQFSPLALDTLRIRVQRHGATASTIVDPCDRVFEASHHAVDYLLMANLRAARRAIGDYRLVELHVRHGARGARRALEEAFGCPVRLSQPDNRLVYPLGTLRAASHLANPRVAEQVAKLAAAMLDEAAPESTFRERVAAATRALLAMGIRPQRASAARRLRVSERSLQRGLADERTSFRAVRDAVLWEMVEVLLATSDLKIEAVALSVGFADVAAFSKAFKRWAGCPPAHYRAQLGRAARA